MEPATVPIYPHWIPGLIAAGTGAEQGLVQVLAWVESQLPGTLGSIYVGPEHTGPLADRSFCTPNPTPLQLKRIRAFNQQGWIQLTQSDQQTFELGEWHPLRSAQHQLLGLLGLYDLDLNPDVTPSIPAQAQAQIRVWAVDLVRLILQQDRGHPQLGRPHSGTRDPLRRQISVPPEPIWGDPSVGHLYLLQQAIQACSHGVVIADAQQSDYPVIYVNPAFERLTGYTSAEVLGLNCRHLQGGDRDQPERGQIRSALAQGEDCRVTLCNYRKDGTPFWNELYLSPVQDHTGQISHYIGIQTDVSQRRQAEAHLRMSEARLRTLVENIPFCVWARDTDLRLVLQNEANRQLYGNELGSRPDESSLPPYRVARWETLMRRALQETVIQVESTEMIDNEPRYFHRITMSVPEATEGIKYMGIGIDITRRKQMEMELDRFFRVSLDLLCIADTEGRFQRVNPAWESTLGYAQHELEGQYLLDWVHPEDQVDTLEALDQLRQGSQILNFVNRYRAKDGQYRYMEWRSFPYGHLIYAAARDITDRKLTELALRKTDQDLRHRIQFESLLTQISAEFITLTTDQIETRIRSVLHQIREFLDLDQVYLYCLDGDGPRVFLCSCSSPELTAHCDDTLTRLDEIQDLRHWLDHHQSLWIPCLEDLFPEGTTERQQLHNTGIRSMALLPLFRGTQVIGSITLESHRQRRDWSPHECSLLTTFSQILSNTLERRRIERQRNEFTAIVSHELRTPLTSIRALLGLLTTGRLGSFSPRGQGLLTAALADTDRLERLVNELLDLERLRTGRIELSHRWSSVPHLLERLVQTLHPLAEEAAITLTFHTSVDQVWADPDRLLQVLTNLVGNAIKFSPPDSLIQITVSQQFDTLHWRVSDQGHGIPADKLDTIFEPFVQVNSSDARPQSGTGLGLAICRQIIHHHQGHLWVESGPRGSTFAFTMPHPIP